MRKSETGSVHIIIISVLVIALIGAMGFIFWQNFINKPVTDDNSKNTATQTQKSPSPSVAATKTYCTLNEKLCFDYPSTWSYSANTVTQGGIKADSVTIKNDKNESILQLETGLYGIGGACGDDGSSYSKVLKTHTSGITGSYLGNGSNGRNIDTVYAVNVISYIGINKNWTAQMSLNNSSAVATVGRKGSCDVAFNTFYGKNVTIPDDNTAHGSISFTLYTEDGSPETFATESAATASLETPDMIKAFAVLQSARYQ